MYAELVRSPDDMRNVGWAEIAAVVTMTVLPVGVKSEVPNYVLKKPSPEHREAIAARWREVRRMSDDLVAHELAHHWFGDLVTCRDWSHAWLNEGFATYMESVDREAHKGKDEYEHGLLGELGGYVAEARGRYHRPIVCNDYELPIDLFDRHLYEKGGLVLHVLRAELDDGDPNTTKASAVFSGIDADPIVQSGVAVVTNATGEMQASALLNGRPLWQAKIGAHNMPWSAGNALFVLSSGHQLAALFKRNGAVRWATNLATYDTRNPNKDTTPALLAVSP